MSNVAKLKKQAAEFELKKQFDKALAIYVKMLESFDPNDAELDVALFNRVGDLMLRQGNVADAVDYYERAVDHYSETGFFNNAIALCNKILRHSPGRASVYYKLGKISAQKGFGKDAKVNFLEYADRMQKAGKVDEAFRALTEFADLCPDQDEIRLMLADQLTKAGRKDEAVEQLQILHERYDGDGHTAEAAATATRMRAIDPKVEPRAAASGRRKTTSGELIFIDLDAPSLSRPRSQTPVPTRPAVPEPQPGELSFIIPTPEPPEGVPQVADPRLEAKTLEEPLPTRVTPAVEPVPEEPVVEKAGLGEPVLEPVVFQQPVIEEPVFESLLDEPAIDEPVLQEAAFEEPVVEEPVVETAAPAHDIATPVVAADPVFEAAAPVEQMPVEEQQFEPAEFDATELDEPRFEEHPIGERLLGEELLADEPNITFAAEAMAAEAGEETAFSDAEPESFAPDEATPMDAVRFTDPDVGIVGSSTDVPSSYLSRLTDPGFDAVEPPMQPPSTITRLTDPDFDAVQPLPDSPLREPPLRAAKATEYDRSATPAFVLDDPLGEMANADISRAMDADIGIIKSTPSAPLLTMGAALEEESAPLTPTPISLVGFEPTALDGSPLEASPEEQLQESEEQLRASIEGAAGTSGPSTADGDLNLILPDAIQAPKTPESIDLDLSQMVTPPAPSRPTPNSTRAALEGLPLMDIDVPRTTVAPRSLPGGELELVEQPLRIPPGISNPTPAFGIDSDAESLTIDGVRIAMPTPSSTRKSTLVAAQAVTALKKSLEDEPENWGLHRQLAEAMLEAGDRYGGISELELAMAGAERSHDLELASSLAEEIARLEPDSVKHHQKRVEFAFLTNDRSRLIEAYVALADALLRGDQQDKARVVYQRVLDLAPDEIRARAALDTIPVATPESMAPVSRSSSAQRQSSKTSASAKSNAQSSDDSFVNLGDWLRDTQAPKDTRMVVEEQEPTGDEEADFADMLRKFKQGVAENVDAEDYQSHYDLAIAFKEMGLLDEAIAQFQKALGSPTNRLPTYEALGQCFMEKSQFKLASSILGRALSERASEDKLVGVLYLLGRAAEAQGNPGDAMGYYQRVFVQDIQFRDVADRLSSLERAAR